LAAALLEAKNLPTADNLRRVAEAYRQIGVLDVAYDYLSRALRLNPGDGRAFDERARIWRDWGYPHLGLGDAYRAVHHAPDSAAAYNTLGTLLQGVGTRRGARRAYEDALRIDPHASYALNNLCYLSFLEGRARTAVTACESALRLAPRVAATHNNLGLAYASLGDLQSAHRQFSSEGDRATAAYNMGIVYLAKKEFGKAADAFQEAYGARPSLTLARDRAKQALTLASKEADLPRVQP
jgi:Flp pilus assembly protein TadD